MCVCCLLLAKPGIAGEEVLLPVPESSVFAGQRLSASQFTLKLFIVSHSSRQSYVFDVKQLARMQALRTLVAGKPIALRSLRLIDDVSKGRPTKAYYVSDTIEIQGMVIPLASGSSGEIIDARNAASQEIVKAEVMADGTLLVRQK